MIAEAESMLSELAADIDRTGGQDIGQQFWEPSAEVAAEDDVVIASDEQHVPQTVAAREATPPADTTETAQPSVPEEAAEAPAADPGDNQEETSASATSDEQEQQVCNFRSCHCCHL